MIEFRNVAKAFAAKKGRVQALEDVSLTIRSERVYGLLGPNGAGKTTALRIMATLLKPDAGEVRIAGVDAIRRPAEARKQLGFLTGDTRLYDRITPQETIRYFGKLYGMSAEDIRRRTDELVELLQMSDYLGRRVGKLSTGQKQKVSIARAVVHNPPVIILDEPTAGLDVLASRNVVEFISHAATDGKTVLFSTHIMSEADRSCADVAMIHKGRVLLEGGLPELKAEYPDETLEEIFLRKLNHDSLAEPV